MIEVKGMKFPLDRKYYIKDGAHLWLKSEGDFIKIGMDAFAAEILGVLTVLNVNKKHVKSGEPIGSFESAKFVSRFYSPISGEIIAVNNQVLSNPKKINDNPYDSWIILMKPDNNKKRYKNIIKGKDEISKWISKEIKRMQSNK